MSGALAPEVKAGIEEAARQVTLILLGREYRTRIAALVGVLAAEMEVSTGGVPELRARFADLVLNTMAAFVRHTDQELMDWLKATIRGVPVPPAPPPPMTQ